MELFSDGHLFCVLSNALIAARFCFAVMATVTLISIIVNILSTAANLCVPCCVVLSCRVVCTTEEVVQL